MSPFEALTVVRLAWTPVVAAQADDPRMGSKFGGVPYTSANAPWPHCGQCQRPLSLFAQLEGASLPAGAPVHWDGLLQVFVCTQSDGSCDTWAPFSSAHCVRVVRPDAATATNDPAVDDAQVFDAQPITGWTETEDEPNWEERAAYDLPAASDDSPYPLSGEKLGGWPCWVQGVEYPDCPECGTAMGLVLQIDSNGLVDWMWGDSGCAHVTRCAHHPDQWALGWACC